MPTTGKDCAYIILNVNKPLINQIFTAAHEFYHYIKDYKKFRETPYICDFNKLKDINEMCASRFAAELLLPEEALLREIKDYLVNMKIPDTSKIDLSSVCDFDDFFNSKISNAIESCDLQIGRGRIHLKISKNILKIMNS